VEVQQLVVGLQLQGKGIRSMLEILSQVLITYSSCRLLSKFIQASMKPKSYVTRLLEFLKDMVSSNSALKKSLNALFRKCKEKQFLEEPLK
jgi:hypothetical protein